MAGSGDNYTTQSKSEREILCDITYMWNLKYHISEHIYETETDSQTQRTDVRLPRGQELGVEEGGGVWDQQMKAVININNKFLPYSTGNYIQYSVINHKGKEYVYMCN